MRRPDTAAADLAFTQISPRRSTLAIGTNSHPTLVRLNRQGEVTLEAVNLPQALARRPMQPRHDRHMTGVAGIALTPLLIRDGRQLNLDRLVNTIDRHMQIRPTTRIRKRVLNTGDITLIGHPLGKSPLIGQMGIRPTRRSPSTAESALSIHMVTKMCRSQRTRHNRKLPTTASGLPGTPEMRMGLA